MTPPLGGSLAPHVDGHMNSAFILENSTNGHPSVRIMQELYHNLTPLLDLLSSPTSSSPNPVTKAASLPFILQNRSQLRPKGNHTMCVPLNIYAVSYDDDKLPKVPFQELYT